MQTRDHKALAEYLVSKEKSKISAADAAAFVHGSVAPDYNMLTYLRGGKKCKGHNRENTRGYIAAAAERFAESVSHGRGDYYALGKAIHYLADSFTYPHTAAYNGTLKGHLVYERELHEVISEALGAEGSKPERINGGLGTYLSERYSHCDALAPCCRRDCAEIEEACAAVLRYALAKAPSAAPEVSARLACAV